MTRTVHQHTTAERARILNPGDIYITLDGHHLTITPAPRGHLACEGCYYRQPTGLTCHSQPPCKWHTRHDNQNIIYKPQ